MAQTLTEKLTATPEGMKLYQQERAILELTELLCEIMEGQGVTRSELARRLGKTKGYITQLLDGRTNMTVRTMSDVFGVLDRAVHFQDGALSVTVQAAPLFSIREGLSWGSESGRWPIEMSIEPALTSVARRMVS
jgi:transcriptional regulator with XRE-family HTH domain